MKLLVVAPYFYPKIGGMENYAWNIIKRLHHRYKWKVSVITSNHKSNSYKEEVIEGIKIYRLPSLFKISNTPINPFWFSQIKSIINKEKPDLINGHTPVPFISDLTAIIAQKEKIPFVLTYQNDIVKTSTLLNMIIKFYYVILGYSTGNRSKRVIASSEFYAKRSFFLNRYKHKVEVVSPGVDLDFYNSVKVSLDIKKEFNNNKVVLFVGQLDKTHIHKGLYNLINAINLVRRKVINVKLIIVGKGDMLSDYKQYVSNLKLNRNVVFKTNVNNKDLVKYYKISNLVVLPSINKSEGFGMVLIEAGACKKPVIGSNIGGISYVITDGVTGKLVKPGNVQDLAKNITAILEDKTIAQVYGENGYERVRQKFTWNKQVYNTNSIFRKVVAIQ